MSNTIGRKNIPNNLKHKIGFPKKCCYKNSRFCVVSKTVYYFCHFSFFIGSKAVTLYIIAHGQLEVMWGGEILCFLLSRSAFLANSKISADEYSKKAAK